MKYPIRITTIVGLCIMATGTLSGQTSPKNAEIRRLEPLIGKWITIGETAGNPSSKAMAIRSSDIYEWATGGCFIIHHIYGLIGNQEGGGVEIIGYDEKNNVYTSWFFDNNGNSSTGKLTYHDKVLSWEGQKLRGSGEFKQDGKILIARHQRLNERGEWVPSMEVTLSKVE